MVAKFFVHYGLNTVNTGLVVGDELNTEAAWEKVEALESLRSKLPDLVGLFIIDEDLWRFNTFKFSAWEVTVVYDLISSVFGSEALHQIDKMI